MEWARVMNLESYDRVDSMILSSFHTGPDRNRVLYILIMRRVHSSVSNRKRYSFHMDPYVLTFHFGLGIGVIGPDFYISLLILIWDPIHLFSLGFY
jgi:hypothetical protein